MWHWNHCLWNSEAIFEKLIEDTFKTEPAAHSQAVATLLVKDKENDVCVDV